MDVMRLFMNLLGIIAICLIAAAAYVWTGSYNVAANVPHWNITYDLLELVRDRSIAAHAKGIAVPRLNDRRIAERGFPLFHEMCRLCHGAPGYPREEFARGLYPSPPDFTLEDFQDEAKDAEIFWVAKNGLKMSGMPSFGSTHSDDDLWGVVALIRILPKLEAEEYESMVQSLDQQPQNEGGHSHRGQ